MAWGKNPWYSPRSIKAPVRTVTPTTEVVEVRLGPNSVRYETRIVEPDNKTIGYNRNKPLTKREKKQQRNHRSWYGTADDDYYGGYVDADFGDLNPKSRYAWTPTKWSSFSFSSFGTGVYSDDDTNLFVKEPENYITPTKDTIMAQTSFWAQEDINRIKELARACYLKMIDDRDYINPKHSDPHESGFGERIWKEKKELVDSVFETYIPGFTPLEQAIAVAMKYRDKKSRDNQRTDTGMKSEHCGVSFKRTDYADPTVLCQMDKNAVNNKYKLRILNNIAIIGNLGTQFHVEKETGVKEVANSPFLKRKIMRDYEQLRLVTPYQRILPNFRTKFLTKDLTIEVPVSTSEKKQKIIILGDYSGSMNDMNKQIWLNSILIDRFRYVIKGEAEVYFSFFVNHPDQLHFVHVKNEKDVNDFWAGHCNSPNGSLTDMGRIVSYVADEVNNGKLHNLDIDLSVEKPEILIINDGQDRVGHNSFRYKVNAISLIEFSNELKNLCIKSGGKQVSVTRDGIVHAYSSSGVEEITED